MVKKGHFLGKFCELTLLTEQGVFIRKSRYGSAQQKPIFSNRRSASGRSVTTKNRLLLGRSRSAYSNEHPSEGILRTELWLH